jgi:hypothetical protein
VSQFDLQLTCFSGRNEIVGCQSTVRTTTYIDLHEPTVFDFDRTAPHVVAVAAIVTTEWLIKSVVRVLQSGKEKSVVIVHCATHIYCVCLWARSLAIHLV